MIVEGDEIQITIGRVAFEASSSKAPKKDAKQVFSSYQVGWVHNDPNDIILKNANVRVNLVSQDDALEVILFMNIHKIFIILVSKNNLTNINFIKHSTKQDYRKRNSDLPMSLLVSL